MFIGVVRAILAVWLLILNLSDERNQREGRNQKLRLSIFDLVYLLLADSIKHVLDNLYLCSLTRVYLNLPSIMR